jgi:hypothetical protein
LFLDAIEESFEMVELAYSRLQESLAVFSSQSSQFSAAAEVARLSPTEMSRLNSTILLDAWSHVDVLNRLRVLVDSMPGLRKSRPAVQSCLRSLGPIEDLRNAVQHLYGEVDKIADTGHPIWGSLSWARPPGKPGEQLQVNVFIPGTLARVKGVPAVNPVGLQCEVPVGLIQLTAAAKTISLSKMAAAVRLFATRLSRAAAAVTDPGDGSNVVFNLEES